MIEENPKLEDAYLLPGMEVLGDFGTAAIANIFDLDNNPISKIPFKHRSRAVFQLDTGETTNGIYIHASPDIRETMSYLSGLSMEQELLDSGEDIIEKGSIFRHKGCNKIHFVRYIVPADEDTYIYFEREFANLGADIEDTFKEKQPINLINDGWYDISDWNKEFIEGDQIELWPGPYVHQGELVMARYKGNMIVVRVGDFFLDLATEENDEELQRSEIFVSSVPWDREARKFYKAGLYSPDLEYVIDIIPATDIFPFKSDSGFLPPAPTFRSPDMSPPSSPAFPAAPVPIHRPEAPQIYIPPEPVIIKPPKVKIIRPPEPEIYRPSPPEPAPPEPLPPEELPERERKLIKVKKKIKLLANPPKSINDKDISENEILSIGDYVEYDDNGIKKGGYINKIWWSAESVKNLYLKTGIIEGTPFKDPEGNESRYRGMFELSSEIMIPDERPVTISGAQITAYEKISPEKKKQWDEIEEFEEKAEKIWKGDLAYVPHSVLPQVIERIMTQWMGQEVEDISVTKKNLSKAIVTAGGIDVPLKEIEAVPGPYLLPGDMIIWFREANIIEELMDKLPADTAVVLEIRFVENPGVLILRAPWSLKEQYQMKIQLSDNRQIWANGADIQDLEKSQELLVTLEKDWIKPDDILQYYPMVNGVKQKYEYGRVTAVYKAQPIYTDSFTVPDSTVFEPVNMVHVKDQMESAFDIYSEGKKGIRPPGAAEDDEYEYESKTDRVLGKNVIRKIIPPSPTGAPTIVPTIPSREPEAQEYSGFGPYFQRERKDYGTEIPPIPPIPTEMSPEELQAKRERIWQYAQAAQRAPPPTAAPPIQPTPEFKDIKMIPKKKGGK